MSKYAFVAFAAGLTAAASATPLPPNGFITPLSYYPNTLNTGVTVLEPITDSPFTSANFSGFLRSWVFTGAPDNPYGPSRLTFVYQIYNTSAPGADSFGRFAVNGYGSFGTDVGMDPLGIGGGYIDAYSVDRSADGGTLGWTFLNTGAFSQVGPGQVSSFFVVHTDATQYAWSNAAVIDGAVANANAWAPVPTPGAGALLGVGLVAVARRRRAR